MADQYGLCLEAYKTQLATLSGVYFPEIVGRAAGWQVSEDDTTPREGGTHFIILRPGSFAQLRQGEMQNNDWHVITTIYFRFVEYADAWVLFRAFRSAVLDLPDTAPLKTNGINGQSFSAAENPGYLLDGQGNYTNFIVQSLDCTIKQRVLQRRAF